MPAEWEPHAATWLAWPHEESDWPGQIRSGSVDLRRNRAAPRARGTGTNPCSGFGTARAGALGVLEKCGANTAAVEFFEIPTDRSWTRDFCPIFVKQPGELAITDWIFNGWAKYDNWQRDNAVPAELASRLGLRRFEPGLVLEGGSIDVNGAGVLMTTEECLLSDVQARNPGLSRDALERVMGDYLGIDQVLWLKNGIAGDDTHGHVDDLARFVAPDTIVTVVERDKGEVNWAPLHENLEILRALPDYRIVTLPMPEPVYFDGQRLPASYANFYIANHTVLVPAFNDPHDRIALNTLAELFPDREVIGIGCSDLVLGLGTLHCMTQQEPAVDR
jgi:agmatine deiminase